MNQEKDDNNSFESHFIVSAIVLLPNSVPGLKNYSFPNRTTAPKTSSKFYILPWIKYKNTMLAICRPSVE